MKFCILVFCIIGLTLPACVSVQLGSSKVTKSRDVTFSAPSAPFEAISAPIADQAWRNSKNGNTISYHSSCNDAADPDLQSVSQEFLGSLDSVETQEQNIIRFNEREALHVRSLGLVDGIKSHVEFIVFKKNACLYSLMMTGVDKKFDVDQKTFQTFTSSFKAP